MEDLDAMTKRKGRVQFTSNSLPRVLKLDDHDDVLLNFKKNQNQLKNLLADCKHESKDSKISLHQLQSML